MFMDILVLLQVFGLGWVCCHFFMVYKLRKALKKVAEDNNMTLDELAEGLSGIKTIKVPNFYTETSGNSILLYNKDTGDFVSQALSIDELADNVYRFNKVEFAVVNHKDLQVWFVEGKIKNDLKDLE
jgi:hypothetical protein